MELAVEIEKDQAGFRQEQVLLDFSDDSADDAGNNDKSQLNEYYIQATMLDNSSKRNLSKLPNLASVCDRYGVSIMLVLASAALVDYGIITKVNTSHIIGPQKLGDERRRCREARREAELEIQRNSHPYILMERNP